MTQTISINTINLTQELQERGLTLCYLQEKGIAILDSNNKLFSADAASHCFHVKHLLRRETVNFNSTEYIPCDGELSKYTISEVEKYIQ